jgi:hypothetical protein
MTRYKRHGQERSKQHCSRCGKEGIIDVAGLCKRCRRAVVRARIAAEHAELR